MPTNDQLRAMIERLDKQADELAQDNHLGWGKLDNDVAAMLRELLAEREWAPELARQANEEARKTWPCNKPTQETGE